jgi:acyl-CoA hydrolase
MTLHHHRPMSDIDTETQAGLERPGSEVHLDEWVAPEIADEQGFIRAGKVLEWMDVVGGLAATRHCHRQVVTASVDGMELREPIRVGERVTMLASVGYTSARSMGVSVSMTHGPPDEGTPRRSVAGYMTFVALDEAGRALPVAQFRPETPVEQDRFREGCVRREFRNKLLSGTLPELEAPQAEHSTGRDRALLIRELLKLLPRSLQLPFERPSPTPPRDRRLSYVHKIEPVRASNLNFHGTLYGGTLMRWIETSAQLSARSYLGGASARLIGLHGLTFIRPVERHKFIHIRSIVAHAASDSLTALVNVHAEDPIAGNQVETLRAFLTYAPIAPTTRISPLECAHDEERALFAEIEHRLALQRTLRHEPGEAPPSADPMPPRGGGWPRLVAGSELP